MKILVINAGSSSCKYQLFEMEDKSVLCSGIVERIGASMGKLAHKLFPDSDKEEKIIIEKGFPTHVEGMEAVISLLTDAEKGVIKDVSEISVIGHRVLHGGEDIKQPVLIDEKAKEIIRKYIPLGPLHNPANLMGIEVAEKLLPGIPNVGVFDTEFGSSMAPEAYIYPLPYEIYEEHNVRRYGFHGTSHKYIAKKTAEFLGKPQSELNSITLHLGNGSSASAVKNGVCEDTSMGLTPLEGLMMGTRCGTIDPAIVPFLQDKLGLSTSEVDTLMNKKSGLVGICGNSDMRDVHDMRDAGDVKAQLAFDMLCRSIKKQLGAYFFLLGRVDAIVFTAGIGENDEFVRAGVIKGLEPLGIVLDEAENDIRRGIARYISKPESKIPVLIIPTNEELQIAETAMEVVKG